jgi:NADH-quinone oxidoreductase subunit G
MKNGEFNCPAKDKFLIADKNIDLEFSSADKIFEQTLNEESSGILGLSLGDVNVKQNSKKFPDQLVENKITENSAFYFEFDDVKVQPQCKVPTLKDYLGIKGKIIMGDFPYNVAPEECEITRVKKTQVLQILKHEIVPQGDTTSLAIQFDMERCVGCQQCVKACKNIAGQDILECEKKKIAHTASGKWLADSRCISCGQCTLACGTKAITEKFDIDELKEILQNKEKNGKILTCQIAPAIRINTAEALGVKPGEISTGKIITALKQLGFDYVFDTNFGADLTIVEEATELIHRMNDPEAVFPMFTSCCPAWINYIEISRPDLIPNLSSCRSPLSMLAAVVKNIFPKKIGVDRSKIYHVAFMPCTAKKDEIRRPQLNGETDLVITSRELAQLIKDAKIDFKNIPDSEPDTLYSEYTGGAAIFCATGGVMEAAVRSAYKFITGRDMNPIQLKEVRGVDEGIKVATVDINGFKLNLAVAHGIKNAMDLLAKIKDKEPGFENIHFLEVMACPGGCAMGGGSPRAKGQKGIDKRLDATYKLDDSLPLRTSQDNKQLQALYNESFDGEFGSHYAHELFHTYHTSRKIEKTWGITFKQINFNHTSVTSFYSTSKIRIEFNFLVAPYNFLPILQREFLFLADIKNKCRLLTSPKYQFVLCDKDFDIDVFPKLEFYSADLDHTFVLDGKDLFVYDEDNKHYILLIIFNRFNPVETFWELGLPFLRKEKLFFDSKEEELGICTKGPKITYENSTYVLINAAIITFLCAVIIGLLCQMPNKKGRKRRLNELEDEQEYSNSLN